MIQSWKGDGAEDIFSGVDTKAARHALPKELWRRAVEMLDQLDGATQVGFMSQPPSNRLHKLKGQMKDFWSVSINREYRIVFRHEGGHAYDVEISNHYE